VLYLKEISETEEINKILQINNDVPRNVRPIIGVHDKTKC